MAYQRQFAEFNPQTGDPIGLHPESDPRSAGIKKMPYYGIWLCSLNHDHRVRIIGKEFWHPNRKIVNRITPEYSLHFVLNGAGFMNGIPIRRGDAFLTEPVRSHSIISDPKNPLTLYWMIFDRWCSPDVSEMQRLVFAESPIRHMSHPQRQLIFSVFEMLFDETANPENESRTGFLANAIVSVLSTSEDRTSDTGQPKKLKSTDSILKETLYYINTSFCYPLSVSYLAKRQYISPSYLYRLFMKHVGISPQEYLLNKRLDEGAKYLANHPDIKVRDVASNVGFGSYPTFEKAFRRKYRLSPSEYRKKAQRGEIRLPDASTEDF